jgi:hypothetical protein
VVRIAWTVWSVEVLDLPSYLLAHYSLVYP